ncbi:MAG TPA: hypothetical protein PKV86_10680, partial [Syntrophobacteraceae bacterium]|nr:hypothetical protein [Syntrophobacteraceae bacterium]
QQYDYPEPFKVLVHLWIAPIFLNKKERVIAHRREKGKKKLNRKKHKVGANEERQEQQCTVFIEIAQVMENRFLFVHKWHRSGRR